MTDTIELCVKVPRRVDSFAGAQAAAADTMLVALNGRRSYDPSGPKFA